MKMAMPEKTVKRDALPLFGLVKLFEVFVEEGIFEGHFRQVGFQVFSRWAMAAAILFLLPAILTEILPKKLPAWPAVGHDHDQGNDGLVHRLEVKILHDADHFSFDAGVAKFFPTISCGVFMPRALVAATFSRKEVVSVA
jgi:hypothetical protein